MTANRKKGTPGGDRNVLKLDCGKGCTTVYLYQKSLNCTPTVGELYGMRIILNKAVTNV